MNSAGGSGGSHGVIQRLSPWHRRRRAPAAGRSSTRRRWSPRGTPSGSATCARRGRASRAALQPRQSSCSAGMDALRTATMAHGSTETNAMRADCIAAGSSGLARAQAMLTGETYTCSQRNDRKASVARRSLPRSLPASFVKDRKELITDHLRRNHRSGRRPVARSHCAGSTNGGTSWLASAGVHYAVCTLCRCTRPERAKAPT